MRKKTVGVRLDEDEINALRRHAGGSDSERLRSIIHTHSIAEAIASPIEKRLNDLESKQSKIESELNRLRSVIQKSTDNLNDTNEAITLIYEEVMAIRGKQ